MWKIISALVVVGVGSLVGAHFWRGDDAEQPRFRTLPVRRGDLLIGVSATGTVEPVQIIDVGAQIVGIITEFGPDPDRPGKTIDYRSRVRQGAVLARLDDLPHRAALENAQASLRLQEADLKHAEAREKQAERDFRRAEKLRGTNSEADYENALSQREIAQADRGMSEARLEEAKIALKQAEINLGYTTIRSPVDGVVIDRRVNVGQTVVAGLNAPSLFLLAKDLSHMLVWAAVNEADIGEIAIGQKVSFKVDAYHDHAFTGKVSQIRLNASLLQNVVTYGVVIDVENPDGKLLPYMTAKLQFEVAHRSGIVLIPNQALRWRPLWEEISPSARASLKPPVAGKAPQKEEGEEQDEDAPLRVEVNSPTVWVLAADGLVRPVAVTLGLSDGMVTELAGGELPAGSAVVINAPKESKPDFVSGFVSKVVNIKK
jgi:HlyD family secretion protein